RVHDGRVIYPVQRTGRFVITPSLLGFEFRRRPTLGDSLRLGEIWRRTVDGVWTQRWGEVAQVRDNHNELKVSVSEASALHRQFDFVVRVFNDGVGFRYEFPEQAGM